MKNPLLWVWATVAALACALMWELPGSETVPYHVAWATFALCYGLEPWRPLVTATGLALYSVVSGAILVYRVLEGAIDWQETAEIPLMLLLIALMVWHVQRRQRLLSEVTRMADRERTGARARELLTQRTSHEMRSPLTIASGYLEVLMARHHDDETDEDLKVIDEELNRLNRACDRLIRSLQVQQPLAVTAVDADALLVETVRRWTPVADRSWVVASQAGVIDGSAERLRACLDTLVENAIRYTASGDTIEVYARREGDELVVGVADSGPGFSDQFVEAFVSVHSPDGVRLPDGLDGMAGMDGVDRVDALRDELSQTGLGIGLVVEVARRRGGQVVVGRSAHGGADIALRVPVHAPRGTAWSLDVEQRVVPRGLLTS